MKSISEILANLKGKTVESVCANMKEEMGGAKQITLFFTDGSTVVFNVSNPSREIIFVD